MILFDKPDTGIVNSILLDFNGTGDNYIPEFHNSVSGYNKKTVRGDHFTATGFEDDQCEYCFLSYINPDDNSLSFAKQARQIFHRIDTALAAFGMDFYNVLRTWFYIKDILQWYNDFNAVRNEIFTRKGIDRFVPASTGIGIGHYPYVLTCRALAIKPKTDSIKIRQVASPLQCAATDYKSAFSRAVLVSSDSKDVLLVSGTASINPDGDTAHVADITGQIDLTLKVADEILRAQGMGRNHITRGIAYFREKIYIQDFIRYCRSRQINPGIFQHTVNTICRDNLLFEIEFDAVKPL
jgi:enamine deaminase RidA (YjgF/YER057c/UK114 family)